VNRPERDVRNNARKTHRAGIDAVFVVVVVAQHFARDLADAVDRRGLHDGILRGPVLGRGGAEGADRAGREERAVVLAGHFERVVQRTHVDVPRHLGIALADGREQRHEVEDRVDMVTGDHRGHGRSVKGVEHFERPRFAESLAFAHVGGDDVAVAVDFAQVNRQLGTYLASGAYYQYTFHGFRVIIQK
jgi:hypothetical protein